MTRQENEQSVKTVFEQSKPYNTRIVREFVEDAESVMADAATIFEDMLPGMAYVDNPQSPMASSLF